MNHCAMRYDCQWEADPIAELPEIAVIDSVLFRSYDRATLWNGVGCDEQRHMEMQIFKFVKI
jgi:hypothetical protein